MTKPVAILTFPSTLGFEEKAAMEKANKALANDGYLVVELPSSADLQFYEPQRQKKQPVSVQDDTTSPVTYDISTSWAPPSKQEQGDKVFAYLKERKRRNNG